METIETPRRGGGRVLGPALAAAAWLGSLVWVAGQTGWGGVAVGLLLSVVLTALVVGALLRLGRRRVRSSWVVPAFVWGATIAASAALWSQQGLQALVDATLGTDVGEWLRPLVITPVTEEVFKGLFLVWLLVRHRARFTGLLDGIVYGGLVGAGFSFTENVLYLGGAVADFAAAGAGDPDAATTLGVTLVLRVVMLPFFHPLMVALTGLGVAAAARRTGRAGRAVLPVTGLVAAVVLHGVWDWAGLAGSDPSLIFVIYGVVLVPLFVLVLVVALVLRRRAGRALAAAG